MPTVHDFSISSGGDVVSIDRDDGIPMNLELPDKAYQATGRFFGGASSVSVHRGVKKNLTEELRAYFRFENNLTSSYGDTRTLSGGFSPAYTSGLIGSALNHGLAFTATPFNGMGSIGTASLWVKRDANVTGSFSFGAGSVLSISLVGTTGNVQVSYPAAENIIINTPNDFAAIGDWVFIVFTYNGDTLRLYLNGEFYAAVNLEADLFSFISYASSTSIGNVALDEAGVWSRILADSEIKRLWNKGLGFDPTI